MESTDIAHISFIFVLNVLFFFLGICLNSLVIISFWRSVQLRKKLCYFMIMVLSCCDLLTVLTNHLLIALITIFWLTGHGDAYGFWVDISLSLTNSVLGFSLLALLVMNFDRYLATYHPIFHRTSITKGRLLTLLIVMIILEVCIGFLSTNDLEKSWKSSQTWKSSKIFDAVRGLNINNKIFQDLKKTYFDMHVFHVFTQN